MVLRPTFYQDSPSYFLSDVWREYSHADSRYATRDSFIISMEAVTAAFDGPGCLFVVWGILNHSAWRYTLLILVSCAQIYGDVLYYATCYLEGRFVCPKQRPESTAHIDIAHCRIQHHPCLFESADFAHTRPETQYFWIYFVAVNAIWIVVPLGCIVHAWHKLSAAVAASKKPKSA